MAISTLRPHRLPTLSLALVPLLLLILTGISPASADLDRVCYSIHRPHPRGMCGSVLADLVANVCLWKGRGKRSPEKERIDARLQAIALKPESALSYLNKRGMTGTIVCECCYHQCSIHELQQYCPSKRKRTAYSGFLSRRSSSLEDSLAYDIIN